MCFIFVGMNKVNLHTFIGKCPIETLELLFPKMGKKITSFHTSLIFSWGFLFPAKPSLNDLYCFWTATNNLPPRTSLHVKFHEEQNVFPFAETCFFSLTLLTVHKMYEDFQRFMDIAMSNGSMGIRHSRCFKNWILFTFIFTVHYSLY